MSALKVLSLKPGMPEQLGKYTLDKRIGAGGMADVFLARGPTGVCVVKRPHPHLCNSPEFVKMFLDEASLVAQLNHPGIARVFDLGQVNGVYYLAMEYVPGYDLMTISLEHERQGEYMAPELAARVMADAAQAIHYAHDAVGARGQPLNIIHRDVTPHNILLSTGGAVKIIDFGVAKAANTMHRTQAGLVKGKYPYMAPEQITGQRIDRRVDVYALGLVLYELLTNARAIAGDMEVEQIENARHMRIKPVEQLRPNTPEPLKIILNSCFQMNPEKRYPTAAALAADLEKYLVYEGHKVGQEDLLRLFRVVAAEHSQPADVVPSAPTDKTYKGPIPGPVPVSSSIGGAVGKVLATDAAAAKTDVEVPSNPEVAKPPLAVGVQVGGAAVMQLGAAQEVSPSSSSPPPPELLHPTEQAVPAPTRQLPSNGAAAAMHEPAPVELASRPPSGKTPIGLIVVGVVLLGVVGALGWKVYQGMQVVEAPKDPVVVVPPPPPDAKKDPEPVAPVAEKKDPEPVAPVAEKKDPEPVAPVAEKRDPEPASTKSPKEPGVKSAAPSEVTMTFNSTPETQITVDGKPRGTTPQEVPLKPGKHTVVFLDKASGQKKTHSFAIKAGEKPEPITWEMPPPKEAKTDAKAETKAETKAEAPAEKAPGTLEMECTPFCSSVTVDGKKATGALSKWKATVPEGRHTIEFSVDGAPTQKRDVELKAGATETVSVVFSQ